MLKTILQLQVVHSKMMRKQFRKGEESGEENRAKSAEVGGGGEVGGGEVGELSGSDGAGGEASDVEENREKNVILTKQKKSYIYI